MRRSTASIQVYKLDLKMSADVKTREIDSERCQQDSCLQSVLFFIYIIFLTLGISDTFFCSQQSLF